MLMARPFRIMLSYGLIGGDVMVAQVIAAPIMAVGQVVAAVAKTAVAVVSKVGAATAKAGMSAMKTAGTAMRSGLSSVGQAGKGLLSSARSGPMAPRFNAFATARTSAARMPSRGLGPSPSVGRSPVGQAVQRASTRGSARERVRMPARSHQMDDRDRDVVQAVRRAQNPHSSREEGLVQKLAKLVVEQERQQDQPAPAMDREAMYRAIEAQKESGISPAPDR